MGKNIPILCINQYLLRLISLPDDPGPQNGPGFLFASGCSDHLRRVHSQNTTGNGCLVKFVFSTKDAPEIVVIAEFDGKTRTVKRTFRVVE